jgi:RNA polymerase sigma-70 factor, ECF subfamily
MRDPASMTRETTLPASELAAEESTESAGAMDEESFRAFYARTARPLWAYLARVSGDRALADDLLQETYCRFFTSRPPEMTDAHRKNYLFRIALNLVRDHWRRSKGERQYVTDIESAEEMPASAGSAPAVTGLERRPELGSALERVKPRERELLWLAYVEGFSHKEIAEMTGLKAASLRPMLFRARQALARLLGRPSALRQAQGGEQSRTADGPGQDSSYSAEERERRGTP